MFKTPLCVVALGLDANDTPIWEQRNNPLIWEDEDYYIEAQIGFQCDFCSVPRLPIVYAKWGNTAHHEGGLHDLVYRKDVKVFYKKEGVWKIGMPRSEADALFRKAILQRGYGKSIAYPMWLAVRLGGWPHYQKRCIDYKYKLKIIFPESIE